MLDFVNVSFVCLDILGFLTRLIVFGAVVVTLLVTMALAVIIAEEEE